MHMFGDLFIRILNISLVSCYTIVVVMVIRALILRWERKYAYLLWFVVFLNLCIPFRVTGPFSLVPAWIAEFDIAKENEPENVSESKMDYLAHVEIAETENVSMHHYYTPAEGENSISEEGLSSEAAYVPGTDSNSETVYVPGTDSNNEKIHVGTNLNSERIYVSDPLESSGDYLPNELITEMPSESVHHYYTEGSVPGTDSNDETTYLISEDQNRKLPGEILALVWGIGVLLLTVGNIRAALKLRNRLKNAEPFLDKGTSMRESNENIKVTDAIETPFLWGLFSPIIYLPRGIDADEQAYIIRHENYHRKRKDYIFKPLFFMIAVIHWLNPLVWAAYVLFVRDMEISCDEAVIASADEDIRKKYAASLLKYAARQNGYTLTPITFGEPSLRCRIENVLHYHETNVFFSGCILFAVIVVMTGLMFAPRPAELLDDQGAAQPVIGPEAFVSGEVVSGESNDRIDTSIEDSVFPYKKRALSKEAVPGFSGRKGIDEVNRYRAHRKINKWGTGTWD